jgi:flagellar M-ring protein FliF
VKSIDRVQETAGDPQVPWMERGLQIGREWGGAIALAMFAAWVLWTLRRMAPSATAAANEPETDPFDTRQLKLASAATAEAELEDKPREPTRRDLVQTIVKDNPEMTASVIGRWLQQAAK